MDFSQEELQRAVQFTSRSKKNFKDTDIKRPVLVPLEGIPILLRVLIQHSPWRGEITANSLFAHQNSIQHWRNLMFGSRKAASCEWIAHYILEGIFGLERSKPQKI